MGEFSLVQGVKVADLAGIHECYMTNRIDGQFRFTINISAEKLITFVKNFCITLTEPGFLILEIPTDESEEQLLRLKKTDPFHCDVYYCDGLSKQTLLEIIEKHGELLINDGMACFGFSSHVSHDELYIGRYKIATIFTSDVNKYKEFIGEMKIPFEEEIKTVWENFSHDTPGTTSTITVNDKNIYDLTEDLKDYGLYFAERRVQ